MMAATVIVAAAIPVIAIVEIFLVPFFLMVDLDNPVVDSICLTNSGR